ncbi:MAG: DUF559 domain-containing protein [Thermaceae bacterium]|nr:DUF559 domain-containing protein [Thermaceae bacterium]
MDCCCTYCAGAKLVVEVDSDSHFTKEGLAYDAQRTAYLEGLGLRRSLATSRGCARPSKSTYPSGSSPYRGFELLCPWYATISLHRWHLML